MCPEVPRINSTSPRKLICQKTINRRATGSGYFYQYRIYWAMLRRQLLTCPQITKSVSLADCPICRCRAQRYPLLVEDTSPPARSTTLLRWHFCQLRPGKEEPTKESCEAAPPHECEQLSCRSPWSGPRTGFRASLGHVRGSVPSTTYPKAGRRLH
jgi:hypothetical protein